MNEELWKAYFDNLEKINRENKERTTKILQRINDRYKWQNVVNLILLMALAFALGYFTSWVEMMCKYSGIIP